MTPLPSVPSSSSTSPLAAMSAMVERIGSPASPTPSNVYNVNTSTAPDGLPTYDEAMAGTDRMVESRGMSDLFGYTSPARDHVIACWEAEKWKSLEGTLRDFANSAMGKGDPLAENVLLAASAIENWIRMVMNLPLPTVRGGDPYSRAMGKTIDDVLHKLASLHNELLRQTGKPRAFAPSCSNGFAKLANQIHVFIEAMK